MNLEKVKADVEKHIRSVKDFPKKGINFRDIMPLFAHSTIVDELCRYIAEHVKKDLPGGVDAVAGLEARGFLFGPQIAILLGVPFVAIRKQGKLPGECIRASYVKEYGEDIVEIQNDAIKKGDRILIIDDLLATGGTLKAAVDLLEKAGGVVAEAFIVIELIPLNGRGKVPNIRVTSLLAYNEA